MKVIVLASSSTQIFGYAACHFLLQKKRQKNIKKNFFNTTIVVVNELENRATKQEKRLQRRFKLKGKSERLIQILKIISKRRFVKIDELADELAVSRRTIERDISVLSYDLEYTIYTDTGTYGGVYAMEHWYYDEGLSSTDIAFLKSLLFKLEKSDRAQLERIIKIAQGGKR